MIPNGGLQLLSIVLKVESGEGFQANGKLQTKLPAVPNMESEDRIKG